VARDEPARVEEELRLPSRVVVGSHRQRQDRSCHNSRCHRSDCHSWTGWTVLNSSSIVVVGRFRRANWLRPL
jgi:hypothetical protein